MKSPKEPFGRAICSRGSIARTILFTLVAALKILLSDNTVCGTIMSGSKQSKYTQQRSTQWVYSQSGSINRPGFEGLPAKLRSFERCQVARRRIAYAARLYYEYINRWKPSDPNFDSLSSRARSSATLSLDLKSPLYSSALYRWPPPTLSSPSLSSRCNNRPSCRIRL